MQNRPNLLTSLRNALALPFSVLLSLGVAAAGPSIISQQAEPDPLLVGEAFSVTLQATPDVTSTLVLVDLRSATLIRLRLTPSYDSASGQWVARARIPANIVLSKPVPVTFAAYAFERGRFL
jgi:hypothetical protein